MKLKMKLMAAAVAMAAASGANAAIDTSTSGNGSLVLFAYDTSAGTTAMFDLGVQMDSFLPPAMSAGGSITWNLGSSSVAGTGAYSSFSAALTYGSTFSNFAPATSVKWGVIALDSTGTGLGDDRFLSTTNTPFGTIDNTTKSKLVAFQIVDGFLAGHNLTAGQAAANGASLSTDSGANSNAKFANGFGTGGDWKTNASFNAVANAGTAQSFYLLDTRNSLTNTPATYARVTTFGNPAGNATFLYNDAAGTLTYTAPIPEPATYALLLAGLGMLALMARRRPNNSV